MTDHSHPQSKEELMSEIEREWNLLLEAVAKLSPKQMTTPDSGGWSPKDNLAHLSAWMNVMRRAYLGGEPPHAVLGIDEQKFKGLDEDGENAIIFELNRRRPTDDILNELRIAHSEAIQTLEAMDFQDLMKPFKSGDPEQRPVMEVVLGNTSEHFAEHRIIIERVLNTRNP